MSFPQGINFRTTSGFVTDGANDYGETSLTANYPTTSPQGNNVGWETISSLMDSRDRNSGNDPRLAGIHFDDGSGVGSISTYRIDLPATGSYDIRIAVGDANAGQSYYVEIKDTTTSKFSISGTTSAAQRFKDATNTEYTNATWPGSNTAVNASFATTIARIVRGNGSSVNQVICHVNFAAASGAVAKIGARRNSSPHVARR